MINIGDVVVCVDDSINPAWIHAKRFGTLAVKGALYRVVGVEVAPSGYADVGTVGLLLAGLPGLVMKARRFRKVLPASHAFIEQIRKLTPHRQGVDA